jgi:hypothetical protein
MYLQGGPVCEWNARRVPKGPLTKSVKSGQSQSDVDTGNAGPFPTA